MQNTAEKESVQHARETWALSSLVWPLNATFPLQKKKGVWSERNKVVLNLSAVFLFHGQVKASQTKQWRNQTRRSSTREKPCLFTEVRGRTKAAGGLRWWTQILNHANYLLRLPFGTSVTRTLISHMQSLRFVFPAAPDKSRQIIHKFAPWISECLQCRADHLAHTLPADPPPAVIDRVRDKNMQPECFFFLLLSLSIIINHEMFICESCSRSVFHSLAERLLMLLRMLERGNVDLFSCKRIKIFFFPEDVFFLSSHRKFLCFKRKMFMFWSLDVWAM